MLAERSFQTFRRHRQMAKTLAGHLVNAVGDRRGDRHDADLTNAGGRIIASNDPSMDLWNIAHSYDGIQPGARSGRQVWSEQHLESVLR
jgi:hypothetical protein